MKKIIILFMAILPFVATSCKKETIADFTYDISFNDDGTIATVRTQNLSVNADSYEWTLYKLVDTWGLGVYDSHFYDSSTEHDPIFNINESGSYKLELETSNSKNTSTQEKSFTISLSSGGNGGGTPSNPTGTPTASFTISSSNGNYVPTTISCNNTSTNAVSYQWTLTKPDYTTSTSSSTNPSFTCNQAGNYTLKLIAYNANNASSTAQRSFTLEEPTPSNVTISYLKLEKIPMLDNDNSSWDTGLLGGADPDIYFTIVNSSSTTIYTSATKENVASDDFPVTWYSVNKVLDYGSTYYIKFYDEDGDSDDLMKSCIFETDYLTPGNNSYTWTASNGTVKFTVGLTW